MTRNIEASSSPVEFATTGGGSWPTWDRYLKIEGKQAYHLGNICGTCKFLFERMEGANKPVAFLSCLDRAADAQHPLFMRKQPHSCEAWSTVRRSGDFYAGQSTCSGQKSGFVITGDFERHFTVDKWRTLKRAEGTTPAGTKFSYHFDWTYLGACPRDIPAGQEKRPDGLITDIDALVLY